MIRPRSLGAAIAVTIVAAALGAAADPIAPADPPLRVRIDVACAAAIDRDQLVAALAIELAGSGWIIAGDGAHELRFTVEASPCTAAAARTPDAAVRLALDAGPAGAQVIGPIELAPAARVRGLALLIAEILPEVAARRRHAPPSLTPADTALPRLEAAARQDATAMPGFETALTLIRRWYLWHPDQVATGVRLTARHAILTRWLRAGFDLGADQITTPFDYFEMFAARAGAQLGIRFSPIHRLAIELGARAELAVAYTRGATTYAVSPSWIDTTGAGGVIAATLEVSPSVSARVELEASGIIRADTVMLTWLPPDLDNQPFAARAFSSSLALSIGLSIR